MYLHGCLGRKAKKSLWPNTQTASHAHVIEEGSSAVRGRLYLDAKRQKVGIRKDKVYIEGYVSAYCTDEQRNQGCQIN